MILYVKEERLISLEAEEAGKRILGEKAKEAIRLKRILFTVKMLSDKDWENFEVSKEIMR